MGAHSHAPSIVRRMLDPIFIGACFVGVTFIGLTVVSQKAPPAVPSVEPHQAVVAVPVPSIEPHQEVVAAAVPSKESSKKPMTTSMAASVPVILEIDAIDIRAPLHAVGLDDDGTIETPAGERYDQPAWYKHSPSPGAIGPSIILGHVDSAANGPSIFYRLGDLTRGDWVVVTRADGSVARFSVDSVHRFAKDDFPTKLVYGDLDHAGLRLVTCGGEFDEVAGHYVDNVVVFASLEDASS